MISVIVFTIMSVIIVSFVSFIGIITLFFRREKINNLIILLVSTSAGTLFGGAFLHMIPEAIEKNNGFGISISLLALLGIVIFFVLDNLIHWGHSYSQSSLMHTKDNSNIGIAYLNLLGDGLHNFLDGLIIAGSYLISISTGIAATIAIVIHEAPQEIADFGVLVYAGLSKSKALFFNFISASFAILGSIIGLIIGLKSEIFINSTVPFAAGAFIYIAGSNLIPELLHSGYKLNDLIKKSIAIVIGMALMYGLLFFE